VENDLSDDYWQQLLQVRDEVNKALEQGRRDQLIGGALEAEVTLYADDALANALATIGDELRFVLLTSKATVQPLAQAPDNATATEMSALKLQVVKATAEKCERCWHHREDVGVNPAHPHLCGRCVTNIEGEGEQRMFA
jgi:isoleucyl-tRNA synthetase